MAGATTSYVYKTADQTRPHALASTETRKGGDVSATTGYTYDPAGNTDTRTVGGREQVLDWNTENTLQKVTEADGTVTEFLDDADGSRLIRRDRTGTTLYLGETELRLDKASGKVEATRYYAHGGQSVAVRTPAGLTWIASDHNGTASVQVEAATQAVTRRHMTPFGEDRGKAAGPWVGEQHFVGGTKDPTGLVHLGARDYDPSTGRFVSVDPIADFSDAQQINGYAYSNNNPVTFADPDGKFFGALIALIRAIIRAVVAVLNYVRWRASQSASSGGMSTMGSANYASAKTDSCPLIQRNYGICDNKEPEDAREQGSFKDILGGIGNAITEGLDAVEYATEPWCWGGNSSCGVNDDYKEFTEKHGVDENTKNYDAGQDFTDAASMFNLAGFAKHFMKNLFKKARKDAPKPDVGNPEAKKSAVPGAPTTPEEAADMLRDLPRWGSGKKTDAAHRAADFAIDDVAGKGKVFEAVGGDKRPFVIVRVPGGMNGKAGRFEWIIEERSSRLMVSHQRFVNGGTINGIPNKR